MDPPRICTIDNLNPSSVLLLFMWLNTDAVVVNDRVERDDWVQRLVVADGVWSGKTAAQSGHYLIDPLRDSANTLFDVVDDFLVCSYVGRGGISHCWVCRLDAGPNEWQLRGHRLDRSELCLHSSHVRPNASHSALHLSNHGAEHIPPSGLQVGEGALSKRMNNIIANALRKKRKDQIKQPPLWIISLNKNYQKL